MIPRIEDQLDTMIICTEQAKRIGLYEHVARHPTSYLACKVNAGVTCQLLNIEQVMQHLRQQIRISYGPR